MEKQTSETHLAHQTAASLVASSELAKLPGEAESPGSFSGLVIFASRPAAFVLPAKPTPLSNHSS